MALDLAAGVDVPVAPLEQPAVAVATITMTTTMSRRLVPMSAVSASRLLRHGPMVCREPGGEWRRCECGRSTR